MRAELVSAFVLHTRSYTDSRVLVELLTAEHGRIGGVARSGGASAGAGRKSSRISGLRPFQPLLVSWQGKSELKTIVHAEAAGATVPLAGQGLYCGMYLNELLLRVTAVGDPQPELFKLYGNALASLAQGQPMEPVLRAFELDLLAELGYGVSFAADAVQGDAIRSDAYYHFDAAEGFMPLNESAAGAFKGELLLAIGRRDFNENATRQAAKRLCRQALHPLLGDRPLKSRELFR